MDLSYSNKSNITFKSIINNNLSKYNKSEDEICQYKIKNLIFHKKCHFTSIFTEYLILDDKQEFLFEFFSKKKSLQNLCRYIKFQNNNLFPTIRGIFGRKVIKNNIKMKKILKNCISEKLKPSLNDDLKNSIEKFSKIIPSDLSDNISEEKEKNININKRGKEHTESESTIDNLNANNDISMSLDLKLNTKYDNKILKNNSGFVKGKNGKNDIELVKMIKCLKRININYIYTKNKSKLNNYILEQNIKKTKKLRHTEVYINSNNKSDNKYNYKNFKIKKSSLNNKSTSLKNIKKSTNNINSKSNKKLNKSNLKNCNGNNNTNNFILNKLNGIINLKANIKTSSKSTSYKKKNLKNKPIKNKRNKIEENFNLPFLSENKVSSFTIGFKKSIYHENKSRQLNTRRGSYKYTKNNKKIFFEENSGSQIKKLILKNKSNKNNKNNISTGGNEIKNFKSKKVYKVSSDNKKGKILIFYKYENNINNLSYRSDNVKKEKSFENKHITYSNNNLFKCKNITILKKKLSNNINIFH